MKKIILSTLLAAICCLSVFTSCSKSDDDEPADYNTLSMIKGSWRLDASDSYIVYTFNGTGSFTYVRTYSSSETNKKEGMYSLRRANEHKLGTVYATIVTNDGYDYRDFQWLNEQHTQFSFDGITYTKQ